MIGGRTATAMLVKEHETDFGVTYRATALFLNDYVTISEATYRHLGEPDRIRVHLSHEERGFGLEDLEHQPIEPKDHPDHCLCDGCVDITGERKNGISFKSAEGQE